MAEYESCTVEALINDIDKGKLVLPAMQRNFVWPQEKICGLFDSLLRDYPIGTFLFWKIDGTEVEDYSFNEFIKSYREMRRGFPRGDEVKPVLSEYVGVLDGQQRITSLYLGIKGALEVHKKAAKWDSESGFEKKYLCMQVLPRSSEQDDGEREEVFAFLPEEGIEDPRIDDYGNCTYWTRVSTVYNMPNSDGDEADYVDDIDCCGFGRELTNVEKKAARQRLKKLGIALRINKAISFYPAENVDLSEVVDIFVRVNSGGQKLSAADLMLSIASGESKADAQAMMADAIRRISDVSRSSDTGFEADNDLILRAGLMFVGEPSLSLQLQTNYSKETVNKIFDHWDAIVDSICRAAEYVEYLGFVGKKLTSKNLILPIAYYFYKHPELSGSYKESTHEGARRDRVFIQQWLLRAMIKSIFRDGTGSTLIRIRNVMDASKAEGFPLEDLMKDQSKRSLAITGETVEDILSYTYKDPRTHSVLILLCNGDNGQPYEVDHIWPKKAFNKKSLDAKLPLADADTRNRYFEGRDSIANLQILRQVQNREKGDCDFGEWCASAMPMPSNANYYYNCMIPEGQPLTFENFPAFTDARRELMRTRIQELLPESYEDILEAKSLH